MRWHPHVEFVLLSSLDRLLPPSALRVKWLTQGVRPAGRNLTQRQSAVCSSPEERGRLEVLAANSPRVTWLTCCWADSSSAPFKKRPEFTSLEEVSSAGEAAVNQDAIHLSPALAAPQTCTDAHLQNPTGDGLDVPHSLNKYACHVLYAKSKTMLRDCSASSFIYKMGEKHLFQGKLKKKKIPRRINGQWPPPLRPGDGWTWRTSR